MRARHHSKGTVKISNSSLLPCQVYNSRVWTSCNLMCRSWKKKKKWKLMQWFSLEGLESLRDAGSQGGGVPWFHPTAGLAVMLLRASAFNTEVSFWSQTFWVISSREILDWQNTAPIFIPSQYPFYIKEVSISLYTTVLTGSRLLRCWPCVKISLVSKLILHEVCHSLVIEW